MSTEHKVSFARVEGAGNTTEASPLVPATVTPEPTTTGAIVPAASTAVATPQPANAMGFWTGDEDGADNDPRDIRFPRLNLVQGMSKADVKAIAPEGEFVLKKSLKLPKPFTAVVVGFRPKVWIEKVKYGGTVQARVAHSLEEVAQLGGTDQYRLSKEMKDSNDVPVSKIPLFDAHVTACLLIKQPEGFDDGNFPYVTEPTDGSAPEAFAVALFTVKSTSFGSFYIPLNSERRGSFKGNFASRYIEISSTQARAWMPTARITTTTSPAIQALVTKILG